MNTGVRRSPGVLGAGALASDYANELLLGTARDLHSAIARRAFEATNRATGGAARLPRTLHDGISRAVYTAIGSTLRTASTRLRAADRRGLGPGVEDSARGRFLVSAVNGLIGDRLAGDEPRLAITLSPRLQGRDVPVDREGLARDYPDATGDVVVFLHGLSENEEHWNRGRERRGGSYGDRLSAETTWTPVYLRANTGLPVADNAVALASMLGRLVEAWPVEVRRIALVGHSMGGLIIRAACAVVTDVAPAWNSLVSDVVLLGTPHLGSPVAKSAHAGAALFRRWPEAAPFGRILEYRSLGILDLRGGLAADVQALPHARYRLVAATLGRTPAHPVSEALGDLLVRYPSATGRPRRGADMFPGADVLHVPGAHHFDLLNHPKVYDAMKSWLTEPRQARETTTR